MGGIGPVCKSKSPERLFPLVRCQRLTHLRQRRSQIDHTIPYTDDLDIGLFPISQSVALNEQILDQLHALDVIGSLTILTMIGSRLGAVSRCETCRAYPKLKNQAPNLWYFIRVTVLDACSSSDAYELARLHIVSQRERRIFLAETADEPISRKPHMIQSPLAKILFRSGWGEPSLRSLHLGTRAI